MNYFGNIFKFTTWGESHGKAIGCVIEGVPSGIELHPEWIQKFLDERRPGKSKFVSQRKEEDKAEILSGISHENLTLGSPISVIIHNNDARPKDYSGINDVFRPSHADYTYHKKYGINATGGGRSSARETACRVIAGAVARKILPGNIEISSAVIRLGELRAQSCDFAFAKTNDLRCPDSQSLTEWERHLKGIRKDGDSIGGIVKIVVTNIPTGLGEPIYGKLDAKIAEAMMGINAVKSVEIGAGTKAAVMLGSEYADQMRHDGNEMKFSSNNSGGILGGISTGQDIEVKITVKPTSSIIKPLKTVDANMQNQLVSTGGRHDPCIAIRACPVAEAMMACVLADFYMINKAFSITKD